MFKLYYDTLPGQRLDQDILALKNPEFEKGLWTKAGGQIHNFMSLLGIDYKWTNNPNDDDVLIIFEIDSASASTTEAILKYASETYKKSIVVSPTEPPPAGLKLDNLAQKFPNVLYVCLGDYNVISILKNFALFPFMTIRALSTATNIEFHYRLSDCCNIKSNKPFMFNHLANFWSFRKYHMHYTLKRYFTQTLNRRAMYSYKPIFWDEKDHNPRLEDNLHLLEHLKVWWREVNNAAPVIAELYPYDDYINSADPDHKDHFKIERLKNDKRFDINNLNHPLPIYRDTHISVISEVTKGRLEFTHNEDIAYSYITEKTIQPLLHGHLFIVNAPDKYSTSYLHAQLGFELYDEIFNYTDIEDIYVDNCADASEFLTAFKIVEQLNNLRNQQIFDNAKILAEKILYNKNMLTSPGSKLRKQLRENFISILEKYRDL